MSTCHWLDLQTLGYQPVMPKNLPNHWEGVHAFCNHQQNITDREFWGFAFHVNRNHTDCKHMH